MKTLVQLTLMTLVCAPAFGQWANVPRRPYRARRMARRIFRRRRRGCPTASRTCPESGTRRPGI